MNNENDNSLDIQKINDTFSAILIKCDIEPFHLAKKNGNLISSWKSKASGQDFMCKFNRIYKKGKN